MHHYALFLLHFNMISVVFGEAVLGPEKGADSQRTVAVSLILVIMSSVYIEAHHRFNCIFSKYLFYFPLKLETGSTVNECTRNFPLRSLLRGNMCQSKSASYNKWRPEFKFSVALVSLAVTYFHENNVTSSWHFLRGDFYTKRKTSHITQHSDWQCKSIPPH